MSGYARLLQMAALMAMGNQSLYSENTGSYFEAAPSTKGQKSMFNQPKKLSKKQKAKLKSKNHDPTNIPNRLHHSGYCLPKI